MARKASTLDRIPLAPVIGAMFGAAAAVLVAATPQWLFEQAVGAPAGLAMRLLAVVAAFAIVGGMTWGLVRIAERLFAAPIVRAPEELDLATFTEALPITKDVRRPISAGELGAPLMSDEALKTILPLEPVDEVSDVPDVDDVEPVVAEQLAEPRPPVGEDASIESLIARLEAGLARYGKPQPPRPTGPAASRSVTPTGSAWIVREDESDDSMPPSMMKRVLAG